MRVNSLSNREQVTTSTTKEVFGDKKFFLTCKPKLKALSYDGIHHAVGPYVGRRSEHAYQLTYMEESISTVADMKKQMTRVYNKIQSSYERIGSFSLLHTRLHSFATR